MNVSSRKLCVVRVGLLILLCMSSAPVVSGQCAIPFSVRGGLDFKDYQIEKGAKISKIELHVKAAALERVENIPLGWTVTVRNEPSGESFLQAAANPGAASIDERAVHNFDLVMVVGEGCGKSFDVSGWLTLKTELHDERRLPYSSFSFTFVEHYNRHILPKH